MPVVFACGTRRPAPSTLRSDTELYAPSVFVRARGRVFVVSYSYAQSILALACVAFPQGAPVTAVSAHPTHAEGGKRVAYIATASQRGQLRVYTVDLENAATRAQLMVTLLSEISCTAGDDVDGLVMCQFHPPSATMSLDGDPAGALCAAAVLCVFGLVVTAHRWRPYHRAT